MVALVPMYMLYFLYDLAAKFLYDRAGTVANIAGRFLHIVVSWA